jgi:hypothetical protein
MIAGVLLVIKPAIIFGSLDSGTANIRKKKL